MSCNIHSLLSSLPTIIIVFLHITIDYATVVINHARGDTPVTESSNMFAFVSSIITAIVGWLGKGGSGKEVGQVCW